MSFVEDEGYDAYDEDDFKQSRQRRINVETITVKEVFMGKWPKVKDENGVSYGVKEDMLSQLEIGKSYEVEIKTRQVVNPKTDKTFTARDIVAISGVSAVKTQSSPVKSDPVKPSNGKYTTEEIETFKKRHEDGLRQSAMKAAAQEVDAIARVWASTSQCKELHLQYIQEQLSAIYRKELDANAKALGVSLEVPF